MTAEEGEGSPQHTISGIVVHPLCVHHIVHRHHIVLLSIAARPHTPQLLHVRTDTEEQAHVHTERPDIRSSFTRDPKDGEVPVVVEFDEFAFVDCADTELPLDGGDEGGALEKGTGEGFNDLLNWASVSQCPV